MCKRCNSTSGTHIKHVPYDQYLNEVTHRLTNGGIFLTTKDEKINTMIIGWGGITYYWNKPIFLVPVRASRYTHPALDSTEYFTVSIPMNSDLKKEISFCGTKSGRDFDKLKECGLTPVPGKFVPVPIIGECSLHYECKVVYKQPIDPSLLNDNINERHYKDSDYHTMFYGEIAACYITDTQGE